MIVSCDVSYENGSNVAVRPNWSVAVTVYVSTPVAASSGTRHQPVQRFVIGRVYPFGCGAGAFGSGEPRNLAGTSIVLPPTLRWTVSVAVFSGSPVPPSNAISRNPMRCPRLNRLVRMQLSSWPTPTNNATSPEMISLPDG